MRKKQIQTSEKGQALVEFALIVPIMMLIFCAIVDFGWVFLNQLSATSLAREGARAGIICANDVDFTQKVKNKIHSTSTIIDDSRAVITVSLSNPSHPSNGDVEVEIEYEVSMLTPMGILFFGANEYTVRAECTMRVE